MLKFHPLKVKTRSEIAEHAVRLAFEVPRGCAIGARFEAGQHIGVRLPAGGEEVRRTYSIVCPTGSEDLSIGVRVQKGGQVSPWLAERLAVGDTIDVLTPNREFPYEDRAASREAVRCVCGWQRHHAGAVDAAATTLAQEPASRFVLFYGNRTIASTMLLDDVLALKNRYPARFSVHFVMSREPHNIALFNGRLDPARIRTLPCTFFDADAVDEYLSAVRARYGPGPA